MDRELPRLLGVKLKMTHGTEYNGCLLVVRHYMPTRVFMTSEGAIGVPSPAAKDLPHS